MKKFKGVLVTAALIALGIGIFKLLNSLSAEAWHIIGEVVLTIVLLIIAGSLYGVAMDQEGDAGK